LSILTILPNKTKENHFNNHSNSTNENKNI